MILRCCICGRVLKNSMGLCGPCARQWGAVGSDGRLRPMAEWPPWLQQLRCDEEAWRRSERAYGRHCVEHQERYELEELELRDSAGE